MYFFLIISLVNSSFAFDLVVNIYWMQKICSLVKTTGLEFDFITAINFLAEY
jgi:hypothetical protein